MVFYVEGDFVIVKLFIEFEVCFFYWFSEDDVVKFGIDFLIVWCVFKC